jgi:hypothetical protein
MSPTPRRRMIPCLNARRTSFKFALPGGVLKRTPKIIGRLSSSYCEYNTTTRQHEKPLVVVFAYVRNNRGKYDVGSKCIHIASCHRKHKPSHQNIIVSYCCSLLAQYNTRIAMISPITRVVKLLLQRTTAKNTEASIAISITFEQKPKSNQSVHSIDHPRLEEAINN